MACTITITTANGNRVEMEVPSLPTSFTELKSVLNSNNKLEELQAYIKQAVGQGSIIKDIKLSDMKESSAIIPNSNISELRKNFPDAGFPETGFEDLRILFINSYKTEDSELQFGIYEQNGKQFFIIDNNKKHINRFAAYLSLLKSIEQDNLLDKLSKKEKEILEECRKGSNYSTVKQMVLEYLNNKDIFRNYRTSDGKSIFSLLNNLLASISTDVRKINFSDTTANEFYQRTKKDGNSWKINKKEFFEQVLLYDEEIKKVIPDTFKKFEEFLSSEELPENFIKLFGNNDNKLESIINYIVAKEPWLNFSYVKTYGKDIVLVDQFPSIQKVYGVGFDTIRKMAYQKYKGWYVFSETRGDEVFYYPSQFFLNEGTRTLQYKSLEEAQNHIDQQILKQPLKLFNFTSIDGGRMVLNKKLSVGTFLEVIDYPLNANTYVKIDSERELLENGTMSDFYTYIQKFDSTGEIAENIQNPQEAVVFLKKKNEGNFDLVKIAKEIHQASFKNYYVENSYNSKSGVSYNVLLPAKDVTIDQYKENTKAPIISLFNAISEMFGSKFGISVEILTNDEIKEKYNVENAKAFILNDKIILNSTLASSSDLFHEYAHLVLGYLKQRNPKIYQDLLQAVWSKMYSGDRNNIVRDYRHLPRMSKLEEGFVYAFGKYITDNLLNKDLQSIFKQNESFIKSGVKSIFDGEDDFDKIFKGDINTVFRRFNLEIGYLLNSDNDFLSFVKSDDFYLQRKKVNWLEKQIEQEKIKEIC